jgi:hypothetical protein
MVKMKNHPKTWSEICGILSENPRLKDIHPWIQPLITDQHKWPSVRALNDAASTLDPKFPWTFVKQEKIPRRARSKGMASLTGYIQLVLDQQKIPVRECLLHDLLNALSFIMFPKAKNALVTRQQSESPRGISPGQNRTRTQDLLTILDEGGVIRLQTLKGQTRDVIFGHAVYEHIINGLKLRAARLDFIVGDEIITQPIQRLINNSDSLLSDWLSHDEHCLKAQEFSSVEIP